MPGPPPDLPRPKHLAAGAEAPTWWASIDRRRAAVAVGVSMLALPVVVLDNLSDRSAAEAVEVTASPDALEAATTAPHVELPVVVTIEPATTTTTAAPATTTTTAPPTTTTTTAPPVTTTTAAPTTTTTTTVPPPPAPTNTESGGASWYRRGAGECAHRTLPFGTVVTVTRHANGATATCTVTDRGPFADGRVIDLDASVFEQLAPLGAGVIQVTITW